MHTFHKTLAIAVGISISSPAYSTEIVFDQQLAADYCTKRYSKRGVLDEGLFNYCMDRQTNGYLDALYLQEKY